MTGLIVIITHSKIIGVNGMSKSCAVKGTKNVIGTNVLALRKQKGLRQTDLAAALAEKGVQMSPTGLSKIETQSRMVSDIELVAIAEVLGVSVERLLTE